MSAVADDLASYLQDWGLVNKTGPGTKDVFRDVLMDEPAAAVLIAKGGGLAAQRSHDLRSVMNQGVAITVRDDVYLDGEQRAQDIYDALLEISNTSANGNRLIGANPLGDITYIGRDERDRHKWSMNFVIKKA